MASVSRAPMRAVAHIGITVPDIEAGVAWYEEVFGFEKIVNTHEIDLTSDAAPFRELCESIFGPDFKHMKNAHLATANGTAVELFEFIDPPYQAREDNFEYWRGGIFHFCLVAPDLDEQVKRIVDNGGRQRSQIGRSFPDRPYRAVYCEDPWGTIVELTSHSHERLMSNTD